MSLCITMVELAGVPRPNNGLDTWLVAQKCNAECKGLD
jgi:hypothetical protein